MLRLTETRQSNCSDRSNILFISQSGESLVFPNGLTVSSPFQIPSIHFKQIPAYTLWYEESFLSFSFFYPSYILFLLSFLFLVLCTHFLRQVSQGAGSLYPKRSVFLIQPSPLVPALLGYMLICLEARNLLRVVFTILGMEAELPRNRDKTSQHEPSEFL